MNIETENLVLRNFKLSDLESYCALRNEIKFQRFYDEETESTSYSEFLLNLFIAQGKETPREKFQLAIVKKISDVLIGSCGLRIENPGEASMGCELGRTWHGSGYAREAGIAMLNFGFSHLKLNSVYAETNSKNLAAIRLCKLLGFVITAENKSAKLFKGQHWNTLVLTLSSESWCKRQQA